MVTGRFGNVVDAALTFVMTFWARVSRSGTFVRLKLWEIASLGIFVLVAIGILLLCSFRLRLSLSIRGLRLLVHMPAYKARGVPFRSAIAFIEESRGCKREAQIPIAAGEH